MVYKSYRIKLVARLVLIIAVMALIINFISKPYYYFTVGELIIVLLALLVELIFFIEKGYRQIAQMLESIKERDFSLEFKPVENGAIFNQQAHILNQLVKSYRDVRIDKELHYQFLNLIVDQLNYGIICFDKVGNVRLANNTLRQLCGVNAISHVSALSRLDKKLGNVVMALKTGDDQLISVIKDGEMFKYTISCNDIRLLGESFKLVSLHNIHSTLQEHELDSHKKLIRILTHEIMNSVTPILSLSESMNENLRDDKGNFKRLNEISEQDAEDIVLGYEAIEIRSRALMHFVKDFRSLTRIPEPKFESIQVENLLKNVLSLYKCEMEEKGIKYNVYISPKVNEIYVDRAMIEQVIINLIRNSIDALTNTNWPELRFETETDGVFITLSVTDNGRGIPSENLDKVFIPFFTTKKDGSGIGLSLSQHMMQIQGGSINVKSIQDIKTTFTLKIPVKQSI